MVDVLLMLHLRCNLLGRCDRVVTRWIRLLMYIFRTMMIMRSRRLLTVVRWIIILFNLGNGLIVLRG